MNVKSIELTDSSTKSHNPNIPSTANAIPAGRKIHNIATKQRTIIAYKYSPITAITAECEFAAAGSIKSLHEVRIPVNMVTRTIIKRILPSLSFRTNFITI